MESTVQHQKNFTAKFAKKLASRDYVSAYAMTSSNYQHSTTLEEMSDKFEMIMTPDLNNGKIIVGEYMESWPSKQAGELGWVYVSIGGDIYSEAIVVVVCSEDDQLKINAVEFGRP